MKYRGTILLLAFAAVMLTSGCVAVIAAGVAGVAYINGDAKRTYAASVEACRAGVEASLLSLDMKVISAEGDMLEYRFDARTGDDKAITVVLKAMEGDLTEISVRFGTIGNKKKSSLLHNEFVKNIEERK